MGATTPKLLIPYVVGTDIVPDYPTADKAKADRLEALVQPATLTPLSGTQSGTFGYALLGMWVYVRVDFPSAVFVNGAVVTISASPLPVALRPVGFVARGYADFGGYPGGVTVNAAGVAQARHWAGSDRTGLSGSVFYPVISA